jgi:hypothetical protein
MRKSKVTQELVNGFPSWSKVRSDEQSVGQSYLNVIGLEMELLFTEMFRAEKNMFLSTANVDEIDQTYKLTLPTSFTFSTNSTNALSPEFISPTISGLVNDEWVAITEITDQSIRSFWYEAAPTRITEVDRFNIEGTLVASGTSSDMSLTLINSGLFLDNKLTIEVDGETLITVDSNNVLQRSKVRIQGTTWKETVEQEDSIFLFAETKPSQKAWLNISSIKTLDFPSESSVNIYSHQFNRPYYLDSFETLSQFVESRENLPIFWSIEESIFGDSILHAEVYTVNKAIDLLKSKPARHEFRNWELLDSESQSLLIKDIAMVPFKQMFYAISDNRFFVYDTYLELPDLTLLNPKTPNSLIDLEVSSDYVIRGEELEISPLLARPIKTISKHRMKLTYPDGAEFGILLDGTLVPTTTDFWIVTETSDRFIRQPFVLELDDFGQHVITLEVQYLDEIQEIIERAILVQSKLPLSEIDLSSLIDVPVGIDIDHQGRILILDEDNVVHQMLLHYDVALVDFNLKELILREDYDEIKVIK